MYRFLTCAVIAALVPVGIVHGDVLSNGDFADGLTHWTTAGPVSVTGDPGYEVAILYEEGLLLDGANLHQSF